MNATLGTKRHCPECRAKFYDMGALEVRCPKCAFVFPIHLTPREKPLAVSSQADVSPKRRHYKLSDNDEKIDGLGEVIELEELDDDMYEDFGHLEEVEDHHEEPEVDINGDDADDDMFIDEIGDDDPHLIDEPDDMPFDESEAR